MAHSNLPPGVSERDLPGCGEDERAWDWFLEHVAPAEMPDADLDEAFERWQKNREWDDECERRAMCEED